MLTVRYALVLLLIASSQSALAEEIGSVTIVQNQASVLHKGVAQPVSVEKGAGVFFEDTYQTQQKSKVQILFKDNTTLNITEKSKIQITEYVYDPSKGVRRGVLQVLEGTVRAVVEKLFGSGSKFEIHTPSAVAAARGTDFIVAVATVDSLPVTTISTLEGVVDVSSSDASIVGTVRLEEGHFTIVRMGRPPTPPIPIPGSQQSPVGESIVVPLPH